MEDKFIKRLLTTVTIFLFAFTIGSFIIQFYKDKFDVFMSIYVVSTFAIAILTIAYVLTSNNQYNIMKEQLAEVKISRELESQPLPMLILENIRFEKPKLFYSPPEKEYSAHSRYFVDFKLENKGKYPAVNIDCTGYLHIKDMEKKPLVFSTVSEHFQLLAENDTSKSTDFMFPIDREAKLIKSILYDEINELPLLVVYIHFKNIIGGCFRLTQIFRIMRNSNHNKTLKNWLTTISSFSLQYKTEIDKIQKLIPYKDDIWNTQFEFIKKDFSDRIMEDNINLSLIPLSGSFEVKYLTKDEYANSKKQIQYGTLIPDDLEDCMYDE